MLVADVVYGERITLTARLLKIVTSSSCTNGEVLQVRRRVVIASTPPAAYPCIWIKVTRKVRWGPIARCRIVAMGALESSA